MHKYFAVYKPAGMLSQFITNSSKQQRKSLLGSLSNFPKDTMAVGRLDEKSEGLLLLTTDGNFSNFITTDGRVPKTYTCLIDGIPNQLNISDLEEGVQIGINGKKHMVSAVRAQMIPEPVLPLPQHHIREDRHGPTSWIEISLTQGLFRQVRKMTAAIGLPTLRLVRTKIGVLKLEGMQPGEVRELSLEEINHYFPAYG